MSDQRQRRLRRSFGSAMRFTSRLNNLVAVAAIPAAVAFYPVHAEAYPIDCAILLCMAGGFPASVECSRAKAEAIRRITPWPVEPPLQLWRCPMGIDPKDAALAGITMPSLGPDGLTPEVRGYRDAMEIYHVRYLAHQVGSDGDMTVSDGTQIGAYKTDGDFHWKRASLADAPGWVLEQAGVPSRTAVLSPSYTIAIRGIAFRYADHTGAVHDQFVRY